LFVVWFLGAKLDESKSKLRERLAAVEIQELELYRRQAEARSVKLRLRAQLGLLTDKERDMFARELQSIEDQERFEREVAGGSGQEGVVPSGSSEDQVDLNADLQDFLVLPISGTWLDSALEGVDFGDGTPRPSDERCPDS
jgi:hypothetical protein